MLPDMEAASMCSDTLKVRAMLWTPDETTLISGDHLGVLKFWDTAMYPFQNLQAHKEAIRDLFRGRGPHGCVLLTEI